MRVYGVRWSTSLQLSEAEAREVLEEHGGLVYSAMQWLRIPKHVSLPFDYDDLVTVGQFALLQAWTTHDPARSAFSTWARFQVRRAFLDLLMNSTDQSRGEQQAIRELRRGGADEAVEAKALAAMTRRVVSLEGDVVDEAEPEAVLEQRASLRWLRAKLANGLLTDQERAVMARRLDGATFSEIADERGVSREWIRLIEATVIQKLRAAAIRDRAM